MNPNPSLCPERVRASLIAYRDQGVPPGGFVRAVLENDLLDAITRADAENLVALPSIVAWVYTEMPVSFWKSREAVAAHLAKKWQERVSVANPPLNYEEGPIVRPLKNL